MPYYVHPENADPTTGSPCDSRQSAHETATTCTRETDTKHLVSFVLSDEERSAWRVREYGRFEDGTYQHTPWIDGNEWRVWSPDGTYAHDYGSFAPVAFHFAHISVKHPGMIAYTPTDEHGIQDRQVPMKPGRYLEQFLSNVFTKAQRDGFVERIKAYTGELKIARTPEEIVSVYRNGPNSCMSHCTDDYSTGDIHPVEAYGDSDLGVAYLGELDDVSARCLVWPDRKWYSRLYGDQTLIHVLKAHGYTAPDDAEPGYPGFGGAKVRAIKIDSSRGRTRYVCPYIDVAGSVDVSPDGKHLILRNGNEEGEYSCNETNGLLSGSNSNRHRCAHCDETCDEDDQYCEYCQNDRWECDHCERGGFDSDGYEYVDDTVTCNRCVSNNTHTCDGCSREWTEIDPSSSYCSRCEDHYRECDECGEYYDTRSNYTTREYCADCVPPEDNDDDDDETEETTDTPATALLPAHAPVISDSVKICTYDGSARHVEVLELIGCFAVHATIREAQTDTNHQYTVTHVYSGRAAKRCASLNDARRYAELFARPGIDWYFTRPEDMPQVTRRYAAHVYLHECTPDDVAPTPEPEDVYAALVTAYAEASTR